MCTDDGVAQGNPAEVMMCGGTADNTHGHSEEIDLVLDGAEVPVRM